MTALQKPLSLASAFRRAAALVVVDGLIIGWGFSACVGLWTLFVSLPRALRDADTERRRRRFARAAVYLGAVLLEAYKAEHQCYPATLEEPVPRYVDEVPVAMYIVLLSHFFYYNLPDRPPPPLRLRLPVRSDGVRLRERSLEPARLSHRM
jgi:hypothetical protein